ncbi:MAG: histidinol-phosphate transaminase [Calditrichaeota bacterium]|nr:histidinol-phosphate transaminase [Calditrichota bacterium]MCB9365928.1 histidinol-phosphate transaminase [Calditrichota bacterium]
MSLVPPYIESLIPYQPGKSAAQIRAQYGLTRIVKLASNENPIGSSPKGIATAQAAFHDVQLYPDGGLSLCGKLAKLYEVKPENVVVGNGSESILANIVRTFMCDDEEVLTAEGTFIGIYVSARSRGVKLVTVPLKNFRFDLEAMADAITPKTKIIYLANPNNPTGTYFTKAEFETFMKRVPAHALVILDEAYCEYAEEFEDYPDSMTYRLDNVITLRTFSKAYGLAAIRIGYGFAHETLCTNVRKVKLPFEPSVISEAAGLGALDDTEFLTQTIETNRAGREALPKLFDELGLSWVPTAANFFMLPMESEEKALKFSSELERRGVIVRPLRAFMLPHCVRITIGTAEQNEFLAEVLRDVCMERA